MRAISKMKVIQVEVTNACAHSCSNCTRFCGHFKTPFFMDFDTFTKSVDSLDDYPGMVGIMGGEPTLHPEFDRLIDYYVSKIEPAKEYSNGFDPISNFSKYLIENDMRNIKNRRGLWSSLGKGYYRHFEKIQATFPFQLINDHMNKGLHQSLLITRKELGISDEDWVSMRDNCWAQNMWSASITPKGAFFCEVAAALDMLFDGPGGWAVEPGWWRREPKDFGDQLNWCEFCGATLDVPRIMASLDRDVVSPLLYERLKAIGSPKLERGSVDLLPIDDYTTGGGGSACKYSSEWYLPSGDNTKRVASVNKSICPQTLCGVVLLSESDEVSNEVLFKNLAVFDRSVVIDLSGKLTDDMLAKNDSSTCFCPEDGATLSEIMNGALELLNADDWVVFLASNSQIDSGFRKTFFEWIFNPGCLYFNLPYAGSSLSASTGGRLLLPASPSLSEESLPASLLLFNVRAKALKGREDGIFPDSYEEFVALWSTVKRREIFLLADDNSSERLELLSKGEKQKSLLMTEHILSLWRSLTLLTSSIALFGGGNHTKWLLPLLREHSLPMPSFIIDDAPDSASIFGVEVVLPCDIAERKTDAVVVSSDTYSQEMTSRAKEIFQGSTTPILNPYSDFTSPHFQTG